MGTKGQHATPRPPKPLRKYPDINEIHRNKFERFKPNFLSDQEVFLKPRQRRCYICEYSYKNLKEDDEEEEEEEEE